MLNNLQVLRALAASLVVFAHIGMMEEAALLPVMHFGIYGVDLFFVISGFVMVYTTAGKPIGPAQFMLNRIVRIVPLYWALTLGVFLIALLAPTLMKTTDANLPDLLRSLFFIPFEKSPHVVQPVLFLGWTLNYEMFFYLLFALSLAIRPLGLRTGVMIAVLAVLAAIGLVAPPAGPVTGFYFQPIILEFGLGMAIGYLFHRGDLAAWPRAVPWVLLGVAALWIGWAVWSHAQIDDRLLYFGIPSALIVLAAVMAEAQGARAASPLLLLVGGASYALYLSHPFATIPIEKLAARFGLLHGPALGGVVVLSFAATIVVAILIYRLIELPITHRLRTLTRGRAEARPVTEQIQG